MNTVFTFGSGHECVCGRSLRNCYTVVEAADDQSPRDRMFARWGQKWAFEYPSAAAAGVDTWDMQLVATNFDDLTRCPCGDAMVEQAAMPTRFVEYQTAIATAVFAARVLAAHDYERLVREIDKADALGPVLASSMWIARREAMALDRKVAVSAAAFVAALKGHVEALEKKERGE